MHYWWECKLVHSPTMKNSMGVSQKNKNRTTIQSSNATSGFYPPQNSKNTNSKRYMHPMFTAALLFF